MEKSKKTEVKIGIYKTPFDNYHSYEMPFEHGLPKNKILAFNGIKNYKELGDRLRKELIDKEIKYCVIQPLKFKKSSVVPISELEHIANTISFSPKGKKIINVKINKEVYKDE